MLVTQGAHTTGIHDQGRLGERLADPTDSKRPQDMAVADDHDVAGDGCRVVLSLLFRLPDDGPVVLVADLGDQVVDARDDVLGALAPGTPVAPDVPGAQALGGAARPDLCRCDALVVAVVPFGDPGRDGHGGRGVVW